MGVVTVSSSAGRTPLGLSKSFTRKSTSKRPLVVAFKADKSYDTALAAPQEPTVLPLQVPKDHRKKDRKVKSYVKDVSCDDVQQSSLELDYNEAAAKLESIFKLSPATETSDVSDVDEAIGRGGSRRRKTRDGSGKVDRFLKQTVVRNRYKKVKRLSLDRRIALRRKKEEHVVNSLRQQKDRDTESEKIDRLVRDYSGSTDLVSLDWRTMKIPPVLHSTEHTWLFKLMQPMKALLEVKDQLQKKLGRDPTEGEVAEAMNMNPTEVRKQLGVGRAARNKIIKHNLRLVLFVINKYFQDFANGPGFQDLCQAGVKGLIIAIDRFEPKRRCRLSTYAFFWIRHAIIRSMTVSSFTRVPFGLESIRMAIQRAKLELMFELQREPTVEEIVTKVGISPERYEEVMKASRPIASLNARHAVSQEEFINRITDVDGVGGDSRRQPALLRLALDDALDSLKSNESLVIRQRYGLDGKGDRTLREIAGNLDMSIETVRKHEVKALMKLKHPARADYLRRCVV